MATEGKLSGVEVMRERLLRIQRLLDDVTADLEKRNLSNAEAQIQVSRIVTEMNEVSDVLEHSIFKRSRPAPQPPALRDFPTKPSK